jgi:hypothetical protein
MEMNINEISVVEAQKKSVAAMEAIINSKQAGDFSFVSRDTLAHLFA